MTIIDGAVWMIEVDYVSLGSATLYGVRPEGAYPEMTLPDDWLGIASLVSTLYLADVAWIGTPDDSDRPNIIYEGRLFQALRSDRTAPIEPEESRRVQPQVGVIETANGDGAYDLVLSTLSVDSQDVRAYFGARSGEWADMTTMSLMAARTITPGEETATLSILDRASYLDVLVQSTRYGGTGGVDGTADLDGRAKPLIYGLCRNVTPVPVDPANSVYQVHESSIQAVTAVYDRGVALNDASTDHADYAALIAASITPGDYHTCLALGLFRIEFLVDPGQITADIEGDDLGYYTETIITIAGRLIVRELQSADIDSTSFVAAETYYGGRASGVYLSGGSDLTISAVIDELMAGIGAWWGANRLGLLIFDRLTEPGDGTVVASFGAGDIISVAPDGEPRSPRWIQRIGYRRNWTVQLDADLAGAVTESTRAALAQPYRVATATRTSTASLYPSADDLPEIVGHFDTATDGEWIAEQLVKLFAVPRIVWRVVAPIDRIIKADATALELGDVVRLTYPRFGLDEGAALIVVGIAEDAAAGTATLRLWG